MAIVGADGRTLVDDRVPLTRFLSEPAPPDATWHHAALAYSLAAGMRDEHDTVAKNDIAKVWKAVMGLEITLVAVRHDPGCELARETGEADSCICRPLAMIASPVVGEVLHLIRG